MTGVAPGTFLASLNSDEREALRGVGVRRSFPRGTVLMFQNEPDARLMLLLAGRVKVTRVDHDGHEVLLSIRDPSDMIVGEVMVIGRPGGAIPAARSLLGPPCAGAENGA
jgi:CRP-like cAMP-binding protein